MEDVTRSVEVEGEEEEVEDECKDVTADAAEVEDVADVEHLEKVAERDEAEDEELLLEDIVLLSE